MKLSTLLLIALLSLCVLAQKSHDQNHLSRPHSPPPIQIDETIQQKNMDDPFKRPPTGNPKKRPEHGKQPKGFPTREESEQIWGSYKPFDQDDQKEIRDEDEGYYTEFNELLKWGMIIGSVFLVFVLVKTCARKNGRRQVRRLRQQTLQRVPINPTQQQMGYYFAQPQPQPTPVIINVNQDQVQEQQNLEQRILNAQKELNKLKVMQQGSLQEEFNRKKMQEEQRRIEAINAQRKQAFEQSRRAQTNFNVGYGPVFYGQQQIHNVQPHQQPFQVKGIEPIRQRSNSFKTETSQRPIMTQEVNYRNGIPIGKPIRQNDNDSSFASEYPEV